MDVHARKFLSDNLLYHMENPQRLFHKEVKPQAIGGRKGRYLNR